MNKIKAQTLTRFFRDDVRAWMQNTGTSQYDLAHKLGILQSSLSRFLKSDATGGLSTEATLRLYECVYGCVSAGEYLERLKRGNN